MAAQRRRIGVLGILGGLAGAVQAQSPVGPPVVLPVDGAGPPTHARLVQALGEPPQAEVRAERLEPKPSPTGPVRSSNSGLFNELVVKGGEWVMSYPAWGLVATIDREDRPRTDPPLRWLRLAAPEGATLPSAGLRTPQGLFIGQPRVEALALASRAFRARESPPDSPTITFVAEAGRRLAWMRPVYEMVLTFDGTQRLSVVHYEFKPGLTSAGRWTVAGLLVLGAALLASGLRWLWACRLGAPTLPVASAGATRLVGRSLAFIAGLLALGSLGALGFATSVALNAQGQPYGGMGAFFLGMYALTGLLGSAVLWVIARRIESSA
jgi:hypothetical protein